MPWNIVWNLTDNEIPSRREEVTLKIFKDTNGVISNGELTIETTFEKRRNYKSITIPPDAIFQLKQALQKA
jgi:hypothetical protein